MRGQRGRASQRWLCLGRSLAPFHLIVIGSRPPLPECREQNDTPTSRACGWFAPDPARRLPDLETQATPADGHLATTVIDVQPHGYRARAQIDDGSGGIIAL